MVEAVAAGVDTWSPCWYVDRDSTAGVELDERATVPTARGRLLPDAIAGHRVGWDRRSGMLFAEGHPGDGLLAPDGLPAAFDRLVGGLFEAGVPVPEGLAGDVWLGPGEGRTPGEPGFAGIRRLDSTVDLATASAAEGFAILGGVAGMARDAPRGKAEVIWAADGTSVETVYFRGLSGVKVLGRWYDKGAESRSAPRGRLVRPEDQRRYVKASRRDVCELTSEYVRSRFHERFVPLWRASKGVTVAGPMVIGAKLVEAVQAGEITAPQAERLAGHLLLAAVQERTADRHGPAYGVDPRTARRRRASLRDLGLVLGDGVLTDVEVDLHEVLERALDAEAWRPQG